MLSVLEMIISWFLSSSNSKIPSPFISLYTNFFDMLTTKYIKLIAIAKP